MKDIHHSVNLIDLARSGSIGPIRIGSRLSDFARDVGPPKRWGDFSDPKKLSCIMVFGDVEVGFVGHQNDAIVTWAKFWLHGFNRKCLKFAINSKFEELQICNPFKSKFPSYSIVSKAMENEGIAFTEKFLEPVGSDTTAAMNFGKHLKFYFTESPIPKLTLVCLSQ